MIPAGVVGADMDTVQKGKDEPVLLAESEEQEDGVDCCSQGRWRLEALLGVGGS